TLCLFNQNFLRFISPSVKSGPKRPRTCGNKNSGRLAYQMIIRRGISRVVVADEMHMLVYAVEPTCHENRSSLSGKQARALTAHKLPGQAPVNKPNARFQRA